MFTFLQKLTKFTKSKKNYCENFYYRFVIIIIIIRTTKTSHYWQFTIIRWNVNNVAFEHTHNYVQIAKIERLFKQLTIDFWLNFFIAIAIATMLQQCCNIVSFSLMKYIYKNFFSVHFTLTLLLSVDRQLTRLSHIVNTSMRQIRTSFYDLHWFLTIFMSFFILICIAKYFHNCATTTSTVKMNNMFAIISCFDMNSCQNMK